MGHMLNDFDLVHDKSKSDIPNIATCLDMLKDLQGLKYGSELFYNSVRFMYKKKKKTNGKTFIGLKDPIFQLGWLKTFTMVDITHL